MAAPTSFTLKNKRGQEITVELQRKSVKTMRLHVRRDGSVMVSAPRNMAKKRIEDFVNSRFDWLLEMIKKQKTHYGVSDTPLSLVTGEVLPIGGAPHRIEVARGKATDCRCRGGVLYLFCHDPDSATARKNAFWSFVRAEAARLFEARIALYYPLFAPHPPTLPQIEVKWLTARWGSCTPARNLVILSERLYFLPMPLVDYVVLHEMCHYRHLDHSSAFYAHLSSVLPDYAEKRRALRAYPFPPLPR